MTLREMLEELGYKSIDEIDRADCKKRYRKLMKQNHPDLSSDEADKLKREEKSKRLNEAYSNIEKILQRLAFEASFKQKQEVMAIIPFDSLVKLYDGESIELKDSNGVLNLTKSNIRAHRIILESTCSITDNKTGLISIFNSYTPFSNGDVYEIDCKIPVKDTSPLDVEIRAYNKVTNIQLISLVTKLKLTYKYRVQLIINIQKVVVEGADDVEVK